ncbi:MAG: hypothetical protein B6D35_15025 [Candidatus Brocadia sp. UTAMX2]|jgi:16S rRNA U1498 N3-methylase RsmE|nr:MAG: hypothetical protein B6D35_15025 [Candidatus Brocadia sp. UTAMX2]
MIEKALFDEKFYTTSQILQMLNIAGHKLKYLFDSRKLKAEDFLKLPNGVRVYRHSDLEKIKKALFEVSCK